jgi:hypothetical protein
MDNELNFLSRKAGFNTALRHFKLVTRFVGEVQNGGNIADMLNLSLEEGEVHRDQVKPILNAVAVEKFGYSFKSHNLNRIIEDPNELIGVFSEWSKIHLLFTYFSPTAGLFVINPKRAAHWEQAIPLTKDELVVVYAGSADGGPCDPETLYAAVADCIKILDGEKVKVRKEFANTDKPKPQEQPAVAERSASSGSAQPQPSGGKKRMTPRYGVLVTNELFHNGNVEAWKRIIESYRAKYPSLDVLIWYENERINDINALFKWGKVKHGTPIMISVVGDDIKDVSKLQKYLFEGASSRFEVFLRGAVNRVLDLF